MKKFRAKNRKTQTASLRPKREKQTPFSSVLIPSLDLAAMGPIAAVRGVIRCGVLEPIRMGKMGT